MKNENSNQESTTMNTETQGVQTATPATEAMVAQSAGMEAPETEVTKSERVAQARANISDLKKVRKILGLDQNQLADAIKISQGLVSLIENQKTPYSPKTQRKISSFLDREEAAAKAS